MERKKYIELGQLIIKMGEHYGSRLWGRATLLNLKKVAPEINGLTEMQKITPEWKIYAEDIEKLAAKYADKDGKGQPKRNPQGQYIIIKQDSAYKMKMKELEKAHAEAIEQRKSTQVDIENYLSKEIEIELIKIKVEDLPSQLTPSQYEALEIMIDDKPESNLVSAKVFDEKKLRQVNG